MVEVRPPLPEDPALWFFSAYVAPLAGQRTFGSGGGGRTLWYEPEEDGDDFIGDLAELIHDEMSETTTRPLPPPCLGHPDTMEFMLLARAPGGEIVRVCHSDPRSGRRSAAMAMGRSVSFTTSSGPSLVRS
jgi:hypothetical protein